MVFGPGNRGNVHNLFAQIASGRFLMVGPGRNRKSMVHVENLAAFLRHMAGAPPGVHLYNYADAPDQDMNTLVALVRGAIRGRSGTGPRLPLWAGLALGHLADGLARITGRKLPVSAIRVRKFVSDTAFSSAAQDVPGFAPPVPLTEGIRRTLEAEFPRSVPARTTLGPAPAGAGQGM